MVPPGPSQEARAQATLGLYVHVPFCARRCSYCDFATGSISAEAVERYLSALEIEAARRAPGAAGARFGSVFFGGGTPSMLSSRHFERLWRAIASSFTIATDAEVTLEANPETVRPALLEAWARAGVNRLSMGVQSFDPSELERLDRIHDAERPAAAFALARRHGFRRLSLDLMFGFPGHGRETWRATLERALELEPEHLSAYCFIPEDDAPLGRAVNRREVELPSEEEQAVLYEMLVQRLEAAGFACYETSNFAPPGSECRHNLVYWLRRDWVALGPAAHGLWRGTRFANHRALSTWAEALERGIPCDVEEPETPESRADEIVMLGLRLGCGLVRDDHPRNAWSVVETRYGRALRRAVKEGRLLEADGYRVAPERRFVADDVIAWLMARAEHPCHAA